MDARLKLLSSTMARTRWFLIPNILERTLRTYCHLKWLFLDIFVLQVFFGIDMEDITCDVKPFEVRFKRYDLLYDTFRIYLSSYLSSYLSEFSLFQSFYLSFSSFFPNSFPRSSFLSFFLYFFPTLYLISCCTSL